MQWYMDKGNQILTLYTELYKHRSGRAVAATARAPPGTMAVIIVDSLHCTQREPGSRSDKRVECTNWEYRRVRATHQLPVPQTHWYRRTDGRTCRKNGYGWLGGPTDPCTGQKRVFQASDRRTDGQPENIMPPAPKGGGINIGWVLSFPLLACVARVNAVAITLIL